MGIIIISSVTEALSEVESVDSPSTAESLLTPNVGDCFVASLLAMTLVGVEVFVGVDVWVGVAAFVGAGVDSASLVRIGVVS